MFTAYVVVTIVTIAANAWAALADFAKVQFVVDNSDQLGLPRTWLSTLGWLKAAGAAGLLLALLGVPYIGVAAAGGLVLFFVGALVAHVRARVFGKMIIPGAFLALAAATLALATNLP
ncbi:DoxX family protein [Nonomuraea recticatena]|uniref:DoxX family protein n=1 Tax=Nonomuraea recticatena TaxID=46178 RepID=A0ABN3SKZ2_9ACTN